MKKVLIIAHLNSVSYGSFRPVPLARYLPEFGWEPIILTPLNYKKPGSPFPFRVIDTPYKDSAVIAFVKRLFGFNSVETMGAEIRNHLGVTSKRSVVDFALQAGFEIFAFPDLCQGWQPFALKAAEELLRQEDISVIMSNSHPFTSSLIASELKKRHNIRWIADFCDLWSQNHEYHYSALRRYFDRKLELKTLARADALVTVSEPWAERLRVLHQGKTVHSITHGFAPEEVNEPPAGLTQKFTITYTGTIYTGRQYPTKLFVALKELITEGTLNPEDIEARFYGTWATWLDREIEKYGLSGVVAVYDRVPKETVVAKQRESQLLLLLKWEDTEETGWHSGKIYEYLAARRPILATGGSHDVITDLLTETGAGIDAATVADIKKALVQLYQEYKRHGRVSYAGIEAEIKKYSHREMAKKFAAILDSLT